VLSMLSLSNAPETILEEAIIVAMATRRVSVSSLPSSRTQRG
jgi:hypothetical protein